MCAPMNLPPEWLDEESRRRQARDWRIYTVVMLGMCGVLLAGSLVGLLAIAVSVVLRAFA